MNAEMMTKIQAGIRLKIQEQVLIELPDDELAKLVRVSVTTLLRGSPLIYNRWSSRRCDTD
jgi:hypothetical protein